MNDNSQAVEEVFSMFIPMQIAALDILAEHNLINTPRTFNAEIITALIIKFITVTADEIFHISSQASELVRAADKVGLEIVERKQVKGSDAESIQNLKQIYKSSGVGKRDWKKEVSFCSRD